MVKAENIHSSFIRVSSHKPSILLLYCTHPLLCKPIVLCAGNKGLAPQSKLDAGAHKGPGPGKEEQESLLVFCPSLIEDIIGRAVMGFIYKARQDCLPTRYRPMRRSIL